MTMKMTLEKEVIPTHLKCVICPRYLEDSDFSKDGIVFEDDDENGTFVKENLVGFFDNSPYKDDNSFLDNVGEIYISLTIDLNRGKVAHWPKGIWAKFHYKSCDINDFILYQDEEEIVSLYDKNGYSYVIGPDFMNEYGDYFIMNVDGEGNIIGYNKDKMFRCLEEQVK